MHRRPVEPLILQLAAAEGADDRISERLAAAAPALAAARDELVATWQSLPAAGLPVAQRLLDDYRKGRGRGARQSQLEQLLARGRLLADQVDRVVVLAGRDVCLAAKAVLESCAHPYHNELSRAERGGYPRIYLESGPVDNDALAALLDLLAPPRATAGVDSRWALVIVDDGGADTAVKAQVLTQALAEGLGGDRQRLAQLIVKLPAEDNQNVSDPFTPGVLLPAALVGLDVVGLLSGAAAVLESFIHDGPHDCPALQLAGLCHLAGQTPQACQTTVWSQALESLAGWHEWLRQQAFAGQQPGLQENGSKSATDLHGHRRPEKIVLNLATQRLRRDRLATPDKKLSEIMQTRQAAAVAAQQAAGQVAVELRLPRIDERSIGQLLQLLVLATVVEARLALNSNPRHLHA